MMPGMGKLFLRALLQATAWAHAMTFSALRGQSRPHGAGPGAVLVEFAGVEGPLLKTKRQTRDDDE